MFHTNDQDILLLAHGELTIWRRIMAQTHFAICPRCQSRFAKLVGVSQLLANAVRDGDLPRWSLPDPREAVRTARIASAWAIMALVLLVATTMTLTKGIIILSQHPAHPIAAPRQPGSIPCRPDLHSDECQ
ncbi:MAG: hypothetical protein ABIY70_06520 [Capsulimonas sp.]|uniref:hypothetical protein n=1 Tax=Capsulimonas sp. TaxID=2494211 RepID=UPI00326414D5